MKPAIKPLFVGRLREAERGSIAVELAIVLPLLAILLLGTMELGAIARDHQALQNAAREGARFSAMPANQMDGSTNPGNVLSVIKARVIAYLANENIVVGAGDIAVNQTFPVEIGGLTVEGSQITINYNRSLIFPGVEDLIGVGDIQLTGTAVFRNFYD